MNGVLSQSVGQTGTWIPTFTGFSSAPTNVVAEFSLDAHGWCKFYVNMTAGTANTTAMTMTLPFAGDASGDQRCIIAVNDNGTRRWGELYVFANSSTASVFPLPTEGAWSASSGNKACSGVVIYKTNVV